MKELKLLYVEDEEEHRKDVSTSLNNKKICNDNLKISIEAVETFDNAMEKILSTPYHIIILDIFKGSPNDGEKIGLEILQKVKEKCFVPIIFYSGSTENVQELKSQIVGVATKGDDGIDGLKNEIERLVKFNLPFVKENIHNYLDKEFIKYFWNIIHEENNKFSVDKSDFSLGYLMLRNFGNSLSKTKISEILEDNTLKENKVHPMEFYIYPTMKTEYKSGEILKKDNDVFVILTPNCDFIERFDKSDKSLGRKVGKVLLTKTRLLSEMEDYIKYSQNKNKDNKNNLLELIKSRKGDRYFFLPQTPFIENRVIDFQIKEMVDYENLKDYTRLAKLDSPFAESMISSFIRYYNRIGTPDIDSDLVINSLS